MIGFTSQTTTLFYGYNTLVFSAQFLRTRLLRVRMKTYFRYISIRILVLLIIVIPVDLDAFSCDSIP